jgi:chromosome segregation ATPase
MRKDLSFAVAAAALLFVPASGFAYQQNQSPQNQQQSTAQPASSAQSAAPTPQAVPAQKDSLAAAARRAREEKKEQPKAKVFTNDNLPTVGGISSVGETAAGENGAVDGKAPAAPAASGNDEKAWRAKFAALRHKLEQDQQALDVMQRELEVLNVQYYDNPVKAMQQDLTREDINKKTSDIDAKKQQIEADKQAISDAEDDLRKAGGDSGWAR